MRKMSATGSTKTKEKSIFYFKKCPRPLSRVYVKTEFDWEAKTGIEKSVCKWNCPLMRVSVSGVLTVLEN